MTCASCSLIARRVLHTWQIKLFRLVSRRMICSSQNPNSRRRVCISGEAHNCLMRTATPAWTRANGQTSQRVSSPAPDFVAYVQLISTSQHSSLRINLTTPFLPIHGHNLHSPSNFRPAVSGPEWTVSVFGEGHFFDELLLEAWSFVQRNVLHASKHIGKFRATPRKIE